MAKDEKIGFIGIGNMGWPMASNVLKGGFEVNVFDANTALTQKFAQEVGGRACPNLADLGERSDMVVTMLPTGPIVTNVMLEMEDGGLRQHLKEGTIVVDMSSSEPVGTQKLAAELAKAGVTLIDAPVSGGTPGATAGTLTLMIGGEDDDAIAKITPLLETMGKNLFRTGPVGSGHAVKSLNNYCAAASYAAVAESLIIGKKFGVDPKTVLDIINVSTGRSLTSEHAFPGQVLPRKFAAGFSLALLTKDVEISGGLADACGIDAPVNAAVRKLFHESNDDQPGADFTAALQTWEKKNGVALSD